MKENAANPLVASNDSSDCEICHTIWSGLTNFPDYINSTEIDLGSFEKALSSQCRRHGLLAEWFQKFCVKEHDRFKQFSENVRININRPGVIEMKGATEENFVSVDLLLVWREHGQYHPGIGRILNPKWVDTSFVDHWRRRCLSSHGTRCDNPLKIWPVRPSWVVDTKNKCLTAGGKCISFIALSYRWGKAAGLQIQADTFAKLQRPNALDDPAISSQLAPIVRHAISLTTMIGERYIWVDTLCIDHSRAAESTEQLQLMGAIYANASLTIVALDGDAEDGFPGLKGVSPDRDLQDYPVSFGEEQFIDYGFDLYNLNTIGPYHKRGWTYQEFNMSSRRLIFHERSLHWMCQCSVWEEKLHPEVESERREHIDPFKNEIMRGMPNLRTLGYLLGEYNSRKLKYDEDALPGISGLLTVFSRCFWGGFICGIPEMFFEAALGWQPYFDHTTLRRRVPSDRPASHRLRPCHLPSWSWVGWEGNVTLGEHEAGPAVPIARETEETVPITTWYACDSPTALHKRRIRSFWFENREAYKDFEKPMPPGWTQHTIPYVANPGHRKGQDGYVLLYPDGCDKYTFRHSNMTESEHEYPWHWPFPVPDIQESTQPFMPEQTPYLFCNTRRAHAFAFRADDGYYGNLKATLYSDQDKVIGTLRLHNLEQSQCFPPLEAGWAAAKDIELVAISRARCYSKTFDEENRCWTRPFKKWEQYTVLWVEWVDGVAYRRGCGQVDKEAWEGLMLEDVSLILG